MVKDLTSQDVAENVDELQASYDRLYQEWLGEHRNIGQIDKMLEWMDVKQGMLLDVATGLGYSIDMSRAKGLTPFGLDISSVALKKSKKENPDRKLVHGNGESLPFENNSFDYVICLGSLEHFINPEFGVQEIARVLKPGGKSAIMLPNSHHIQAIYNVYKMGSILPELQDYERFATRVEWHVFLENNGLQVLSTHKYNVGFARVFKKGREGFWYIFNSLYKLFGDRWIPLNLSFALTYICTKAE